MRLGVEAPPVLPLPIVAPPVPKLMLPSMAEVPGPDGGPAAVRITTTSDYVVSWTGSAAGARFRLNLVNATQAPEASLACDFDAAAGTGTVTKEALAVLAGDPQRAGFLTSTQIRTVTYAVGGYVVEMTAVGASQDSVPIRFE